MTKDPRQWEEILVDRRPTLRLFLSFLGGAIIGITLSFFILHMMGYAPLKTLENARQWLHWAVSTQDKDLDDSLKAAEERLNELKLLQEELSKKEGEMAPATEEKKD